MKLIPKLLEVSITTVNRCTRRCPYCYYGTALAAKQKPKIMPLKIFKKILKDLQTIDYDQLISPFEGNEPLLDPRLPSLVSLIHQYLPRAKSFIFTNGDLLTIPLAQRLFRSGLSKIFISLHDQKHEKRLLSLVKIVGVKKFGFYPMYQLDTSGYHNFAGIINTPLVNQKKYPHNGCDLPFRQLVIDVNGNVNLCCVDIADRVSFGNVIHHSVVDIFYHHPRLNYLRQQLNHKHRSLPPCRQCSYSGNSPITAF